MIDDGVDVTQALDGGHLDFPRMREGGLSGAFFSLWVDSRRYHGERAWERVLRMADVVRRVAEVHPDEAALCTTASEVRAAHAAGRIALLMGVEGGHALGTGERATALRRLRHLYGLGVRYMTITWTTDNPLGHSSEGAQPSLGLTDLGRVIVREMNRLGMIVDVSHVSDRTFWDIMELTNRPVLASHSSARALSDHRRNMTDAMIRRVADGGGAVCVNFYADFLDADYGRRKRRLRRRHREWFADRIDPDLRSSERGPLERPLLRELDPTLRPPGMETLVDHMAHVAEVGGMDTPCLGSDFDGISEMPRGFDDVSDLARLGPRLRERGLSVAAIFGANVLRILDAQSGEARSRP